MNNPHIPTTLRKMSDTEAAWVGAIIEGEGSISPYQGHHQLQVGSIEVETISTLLRLSGVGTVYYRVKSSKLSVKPLWVWQVMRVDDVAAVLERVRPFLTSKRERF